MPPMLKWFSPKSVRMWKSDASGVRLTESALSQRAATAAIEYGAAMNAGVGVGVGVERVA